MVLVYPLTPYSPPPPSTLKCFIMLSQITISRRFESIIHPSSDKPYFSSKNLIFMQVPICIIYGPFPICSGGFAPSEYIFTESFDNFEDNREKTVSIGCLWGVSCCKKELFVIEQLKTLKKVTRTFNFK